MAASGGAASVSCVYVVMMVALQAAISVNQLTNSYMLIYMNKDLVALLPVAVLPPSLFLPQYGLPPCGGGTSGTALRCVAGTLLSSVSPHHVAACFGPLDRVCMCVCVCVCARVHV